MPACAGFEPELVSVKTSVVAAPSAIVAAPKVFAALGAFGFTTRQALPPPTVAPVAVTLAARLVKAAGLVAHEALVWVAALVRPATVTVQLPTPAGIAMPVRPERIRVPLAYA